MCKKRLCVKASVCKSGPRCSSDDEEARGGPSSSSADVNWRIWWKKRKNVGKCRKMVISWGFLVEKGDFMGIFQTPFRAKGLFRHK